jgi:hypothetical protein
VIIRYRRAEKVNIENIHVGDKVVITGWKGHTYDYERQEVYGAPAQVVGVCAPYLAIRPVGDDRIVRTVDTRIWCLTKCSDDYAKVFVQSVADVQPQAKMEVKFRGREILCPVCEKGDL